MSALALIRRAAPTEMDVPKTTESVLARLKLERVGLSERAGQIAAVLAKLEAAEDCEREARAALGELGLAEINAVKSWAAGGCVGPSPTVDWSKRDILVRMVGEAMANAEAMRAVAASFRDEERELSVRSAALNQRLEQCAIDVVTEKFADELAALVKFAELVQARVSKTYAFTEFLRAIAERHQMQGRSAEAVALFRRLEGLAGLPQPQFLPSVADVAPKAPAWRELFERLIT